jgi:hypothetical protein
MTLQPLAGRHQLTPLAQARGAAPIWSQWFTHFWMFKGAASYAISLIDLLSGVTAIEGNGAVPWATGTGLSFVAASAKYLKMGVVPTTGNTLLIQYANCVTAVSGWLCEARGAFTRQMGFRVEAASVRYEDGGERDVAPTLATGNLGVTAQQGYRNGVANGAPTAAWTGAGTVELYVGCRNIGGAPSSYCTAEIRALGFKNDGTLTAAQMLAAETAMAAL